jgi:uncharacterized membrane protein
MSPGNSSPPDGDPEPLPFVAKARSVPVTAPLRWLRAGYADMRRAPGISLAYGLALTVLSAIIAYCAWQFGTLGLYFGMATGFLLVGPVLALGLYSFSCQLEQGRKPVLGYCMRAGRSHIRDILIFSFVLLIVFLIWARAATALYIFYPEQTQHSWLDMAMFLGIGSAIGAIFSTVVFTISAFSLPMIMDRRTDAITAVITSVNAVLRNRLTMLVWAGIIVCCVALGFATALLGFIVLLPLIGHATWHAYRETIDATLWPESEKF